MHNTYYYLIISITIIFFIFDKYIDYLNTKNWSSKLPKELKGIYDEEKYSKSQEYQKELYKFNSLAGGISIAITLLILVFFGYGLLDSYLRHFITNKILLTLAFFGIIQTFSFIISKPFSWYRNFTIEEKYGFNKMTPKIFITDSIKELLMMYVLGGVILGAIVWFYSLVGVNFRIYAWALMTGFSVFMLMFYSNLIVPLFNKQTPLEDGELKDAIVDFAKKVGFAIDNIYKIDGSKRSTKANAYFTGLGSKKRIVLYDTLINEYSTEEIVAVLAHEIGHYKKKHTLQGLIFSVLSTGMYLFVFSLFIENADIAQGLGSSIPSFHIGMLAFSILFSPISEVMGILGNILSRKNEYEADNFARDNFSGKFLQQALKKLSVDNLSNLRPHTAYEFIHYSHPTLLKRLANLEK